MRWTLVIVIALALLLGACNNTPPETQQVSLPAAPQGQPAGATEAPSASPTEPPPYPVAEGVYPAAPEAAVVEEPAAAVPDEPAYPAPGPSMLIPGTVVDLEARDGLTLVGSFDAPDTPEPWPVVILLHMLGSDRTAWDAQVPLFLDAGYAVFALDLRGHGATGGEADWDLAAQDLQFLAQVLADQPEIQAGRMAIVGASIGANLALGTGAAVPTIRTVALLSPGLDYQGVTTEGALATYGDRPLLIAASSEDGYAFQSSETLAGQAAGLVNFTRYEGAGHGTNMFNAEPGLIEVILAHLDQYAD